MYYTKCTKVTIAYKELSIIGDSFPYKSCIRKQQPCLFAVFNCQPWSGVNRGVLWLGSFSSYGANVAVYAWPYGDCVARGGAVHFNLNFMSAQIQKSNLLSKRGIIKLLMSVCPSVRPSVRPGPDLRDGWMNDSETHIWYSLVPWDDARCFRILKFSKMADWRPFSELWKILNNSLSI